MDGVSFIRMDLEISAQRIANQLMINNELIETQIAEGIKRGFDDIFNDEEKFIEAIRIETKKNLMETVNKAVLSWEIQQKLQKGIEAAIGDKIQAYSKQVAENVLANFIPKEIFNNESKS